MNRVVVDASALAAIAFGEPEARRLSRLLEGAAVFAPTLLRFEIASAAAKKAKQLREPDGRAVLLAALALALDDDRGITWCDVDVVDAVLVAEATGLTVYDASYLWLAGMLGADLVTLDRQLAKAGASLAI